MTYAQLAVAHLVLRLRPLQRALRVAAKRRAAIAERVSAPAGPPCLSHDDVRALLDDLDDLVGNPGISTGTPSFDEEERKAECDLRAMAKSLGIALPLDRLGLEAFEEEALLLCAAPEVDVAFGAVYGFLHDDLTRRAASVQLVAALTASSLVDKLGRRAALSRWGKLRRCGLVTGNGSGELREELVATPLALDLLFGGNVDPAGTFVDPADVPLDVDETPPAGVDVREHARLADGFARERVRAAGVFGAPGTDVAKAVRSLAAAAKMRLRRLHAIEPAAVRDALDACSVLRAALWIDGELLESAPPGTLDALDRVLAPARVPLVFSGHAPLRPARVLETHPWAELRLAAPGFADRRDAWSKHVPELDADRAAYFATRYRIGAPQLRTVAAVAATRAALLSNGHAASVVDQIDQACEVVTRRKSYTFATLVVPRRTEADLVLPEELKVRVRQIVSFFRALPKVEEEWGFGRLATGAGGVKALFTGESGTGKTLAAEVVAGMLGLPLMRIDLARIVSKWVGETEKNLDVAFREAHESQAVLFFDEADALFGNRAEVRHGTDRYANLEVSYLLQRLEDHPGVVILASNLRDHIDSAFTRRFHVVIGFPRPTAVERKRLWEVAFANAAPLASDVDLGALARLDMTGASIVSTARTAAMLAVDAGCSAIAMEHLVRAAAHQYHREARVLPLAELGSHATLLRGTA